MPTANVTINRVSSDNTYTYTFNVDGTVQTAVISVASIGAVIDAVKTLIAAQGGTVQRASLTVIIT
jgi:hypothetical protein